MVGDSGFELLSQKVGDSNRGLVTAASRCCHRRVVGDSGFKLLSHQFDDSSFEVLSLWFSDSSFEVLSKKGGR